jgi:D-alanine-D-alanine ligase
LLLLPIDNRIRLSEHENFHANEQFLEGSGIWENKGGVAIVLAALQTLRFMRNLKKIRLGILLIPDSSIEGKYSRLLLSKIAERANTIIGFSGSSKNGGIITSRSGSATYKFESRLISKEPAENISTMALNFNKVLAAITNLSKNDEENIIAPYDIAFSSNIFKRYAFGKAGISVRYNTEKEFQFIEERLTRIIAPHKRNRIYRINFEGGQNRPPMLESQETARLYKRIHKITRLIDVRVTKEHRWSSADICNIQNNKNKIDGLGPVGEFLSTGVESILKHSLLERSLLLALLLSETNT